MSLPQFERAVASGELPQPIMLGGEERWSQDTVKTNAPFSADNGGKGGKTQPLQSNDLARGGKKRRWILLPATASAMSSEVRKIPHIKSVIAKGRTYYYFNLGFLPDGRLRYLRVPPPHSLGFPKAYEAALAKRTDGNIEERVRAPRVPSYVYFVGGVDGPIKIGLARYPERRLRTLQSHSPVKLSLLVVCRGGSKMESQYHVHFAKHRLHGEWFERHPDILAEIERLSA